MLETYSKLMVLEKEINRFKLLSFNGMADEQGNPHGIVTVLYGCGLAKMHIATFYGLMEHGLRKFGTLECKNGVKYSGSWLNNLPNENCEHATFHSVSILDYINQTAIIPPVLIRPILEKDNVIDLVKDSDDDWCELDVLSSEE